MPRTQQPGMAGSVTPWAEDDSDARCITDSRNHAPLLLNKPELGRGWSAARYRMGATNTVEGSARLGSEPRLGPARIEPAVFFFGPGRTRREPRREPMRTWSQALDSVRSS
eukprot:2327753-Rhodomonas_salina.2